MTDMYTTSTLNSARESLQNFSRSIIKFDIRIYVTRTPMTLDLIENQNERRVNRLFSRNCTSLQKTKSSKCQIVCQSNGCSIEYTHIFLLSLFYVTKKKKMIWIFFGGKIMMCPICEYSR